MRDKTLPTVIACIDTTLRRFGGCPTYALTDNEKTVTTEHVAGIAIRNPAIVAAGQHYGLTIKTCRVADPESKGGSEATVRVAKADLVPRDTNLLPAYGSFAELEVACEEFCEMVNARPHRVTRRPPVDMLAEERTRLHPLPEHPYTVAFGLTRTVGTTTTMVDFEGGSYSAPHRLAGQQVWVRSHGDDIVIVHVSPAGPVEVARHLRTTPGSPRVDDAHFLSRESDPLHPLHIFPVAGMHEVDAFAKGLIAVHYGPAEIVRHEPFGGFGVLGQKRLEGDSAADVDARSYGRGPRVCGHPPCALSRPPGRSPCRSESPP